MHVRSQRWLGMDVWGKPVVSAKRWNAWEELSLSCCGKDDSTGIFFLARHLGKGEWLSVSPDDGDRELVIQMGRERVNVSMEEI